MHLLQMRLSGLGPFDNIELNFSNEQGVPRPVTVIHGGGGVGKSTVLAALASTRPGNATVVSASLASERDAAGSAVCEYLLGQDDSERPHALVVVSPNTRVYADEDRETLRRREQAFFERASREAGFVFVAIPATRWFSRQPVTLVAPGRNLARYDVRAPSTVDDPSRADLARETKQVLAYAMITSALASQPKERRFEWLANAVMCAVNTLLKLAGFRLVGLDTLSLEPRFSDASGREVYFDALPTRVRNLVAFAALPIRALWAAYPFRDPLEAEGIVTIDEVDLHQDPEILAHLMPALHQALPHVQWIVTATSPSVAASCDVSEVIALRRSSEDGCVEHFVGPMALTH